MSRPPIGSRILAGLSLVLVAVSVTAAPAAAATTYTLWDSTAKNDAIWPTVRTTRTLSAGRYSLRVWGFNPAYVKVTLGSKLIKQVDGSGNAISFSLSRPTLLNFRGVGASPWVRAQLRGPQQTVGAGLPGPAYVVWQKSSKSTGTYSAVATTRTLRPGRYKLSVWGKWAKVYALVGGQEIAMVDQNGQSVPFALTRPTSVRVMATASPEYVKAVLWGPKQ